MSDHDEQTTNELKDPHNGWAYQLPPPEHTEKQTENELLYTNAAERDLSMVSSHLRHYHKTLSTSGLC